MDHAARRQLLRALPAALHALAVGDATRGAHLTLVSWVTQVSFEPPLVALALVRAGHTLPLVEQAGIFTLAPLAAHADAVALARRIGRPGVEVPDKSTGVALGATPAGTPLATLGTLGWLECRVQAVYATGDHALVVAAVVDAALRDAGAAGPLTTAAAGWSYAG